MATADKLAKPRPVPELRFRLIDQKRGHMCWLYPGVEFAEAPRIITFAGHYFVRVSRMREVIGGDEYMLAEVWDAPKNCSAER